MNSPGSGQHSPLHAFSRRAALLAVLLGLWLAASAAEPTPPQQVSVNAQALLFESAVRARAGALYAKSLAMDNADSLLAELEQVRHDPGLSAVRRDAVLYEFVRRHRSSVPGALPEAVLHWLNTYPPQAVRTHDESPTHQIALFDVAGASLGLSNQWRYTSARDALHREPDLRKLMAYCDATSESPCTRGLRAGLRDIAPEHLQRLIASTERDPAAAGELLPWLWLAAADLPSLTQFVTKGRPEQISALLRESTHHLSEQQQHALYSATLAHVDPATRALALAGLAEHAKSKSDSTAFAELLWPLLEDPDLRSSAALQLAKLGASSHAPADVGGKALRAKDMALIIALQDMLQQTADQESP